MPAVTCQKPGRLLSLLGACLLIAACGASRPPAPQLTTIAAPGGFVPLGYSSAASTGVAFGAPSAWHRSTLPAPGVAVLSSGEAVISLWRYPRTGPALMGSAALSGAREALISAAKAKDPSLEVLRSGFSSVETLGAPSSDRTGVVILDALERINGRLRRVRSEHIYPAGAEIVLDEYAPVSAFGRVDHLVFSPVLKKLALLAPGATFG